MILPDSTVVACWCNPFRVLVARNGQGQAIGTEVISDRQSYRLSPGFTRPTVERYHPENAMTSLGVGICVVVVEGSAAPWQARREFSLVAGPNRDGLEGGGWSRSPSESDRCARRHACRERGPLRGSGANGPQWACLSLHVRHRRVGRAPRSDTAAGRAAQRPKT